MNRVAVRGKATQMQKMIFNLLKHHVGNNWAVLGSILCLLSCHAPRALSDSEIEKWILHENLNNSTGAQWRLFDQHIVIYAGIQDVTDEVDVMLSLPDAIPDVAYALCKGKEHVEFKLSDISTRKLYIMVNSDTHIYWLLDARTFSNEVCDSQE